MSKNLKLYSGAETVKKFKKAGWIVARQKGSHVMMIKPNYQWPLSIPQHGELGPGLLRKLIRQAGFSIEEFNDL
jgi:predicted RNA binding protein YcfA (HicA-like mRNA interferase family)